MERAHDSLFADYEKLASELASKKAEDELGLHPDALLSKETLAERYKSELIADFTAFRTQQANGALQLVSSLERLVQEKPDLFTDEIAEGINNIATLSDRIEKDEASFTEQLEQGVTLQQFGNINDKTLELLYQAAKLFLEKEQYDDAVDIFSFLTCLNPQKYAFWLCLGNAEYNRRNFKQALDAYLIAVEATPDDPACLLTISRCYRELSELEKAIETLDRTLSVINETGQHSEWKESLQDEKQQLLQILHH